MIGISVLIKWGAGQSLFVNSQAISYPGLSDYQLRTSWIRLNLAAEVAYIYVKHVGFISVFRSPNFAQQVAMGQHFSSVYYQHPHQSVLVGGQLHLAICHGHQPS